jgi:hypothetical protein
MTKTFQENKTLSYFISTHTDKFKDLEPNPDKPNFGGYDLAINTEHVIFPVNFIAKYKVTRKNKYYDIPEKEIEGNPTLSEDELYDEIWIKNIEVTVNVFSFYESEKEALNLARQFMKQHFSYNENTKTLDKSASFEFVSIQVA